MITRAAGVPADAWYEATDTQLEDFNKFISQLTSEGGCLSTMVRKCRCNACGSSNGVLPYFLRRGCLCVYNGLCRSGMIGYQYLYPNHSNPVSPSWSLIFCCRLRRQGEVRKGMAVRSAAVARGVAALRVAAAEAGPGGSTGMHAPAGKRPKLAGGSTGEGGGAAASMDPVLRQMLTGEAPNKR